MNLKHLIFLSFAFLIPMFLSACTSVESKNSQEVVIESKSNDAGEVYITNADIKEQTEQVSTKRSFDQPEKRILSDQSEIETLIDDFGNKIETRYFSGHPRVRMLILRTSMSGKQEVTVYGQGSDTKMVSGLAGKALTASGDEIADAAEMFTTSGDGAAKNFMKGDRPEPPTPLQPLPSSAFPQPVTPVVQPTPAAQPETAEKSEAPAADPAQPDED